MSVIDTRPSFRLPDQITINFGPADLLAKTFLSLDRAVRERGVYLSISTDFDELVEVNERNRHQWSPLLPMFDPSLGGVTPENSFWIRGVNDRGEVVLVHAARLYLWPETSLFEELETLRFFYPHPQVQKSSGEECIVGTDEARGISGRVCYSGAVWVRPDLRGRGLAHLTPKLVRAYSLTTWYPDFSLGMVQLQNVAGPKAAQTYSWRHVQGGVHWRNSRDHADEIRVAYGWLNRDEVIEDLAETGGASTHPVNLAVV